MWPLASACGGAFGFAYGLTGVGSVFAVPMLVYALGLPPHQAVCVSMISVSAIGLLATILKCRAGEIEMRAGALMAGGGIAGAPLGAWAGRFISGNWLMLVFAAFTAAIALRLLREKTEPGLGASSVAHTGRSQIARLSIAGVFVGIVAGLLGIGGVLIAPSLVLLARVPIHRAISTTMPVVFIISLSAISSHVLAGQRVPTGATLLFAAAGAVGLLAGMRLRHRLSGPRLQTVFAMAILAVAAFILLRSLVSN
jgi:uncharacterized membrane protein YfcA